MTWTKIGDEFVDATLDLSDAAFRTHVEALVYSNRRLLDLAVPKREVRRFSGVEEPDTAIKELVAAGWWTDNGDTWWIGCRWPEWQRDRSQVEHRRAQWSLSQRRRRRHLVGDHSLCLPGRCAHMSTDDTGDDPGRVRVGYGKPPIRASTDEGDQWP